MIKLACIDLDGTLLDNGKSISKRNINALREAHKNGVEIVLASGRRYGSILPYAKEIGIDCYIIAYSGSLIQHSQSKTPIFHETMSWQDTVELIGLVANKVGLIGFYIDDIFHIEQENNWSRMYEDRTTMKCKVVPNLISFLHKTKRDPTRIFILSETINDGTRYYELNQHFDGRLMFVSSWATFLEAGAPEITKGTSLKVLAEKNSWDLRKGVCFGDQDNDIPMFDVCGMSFAMKNATDRVKRMAQFVAPSNYDSGVAIIIERLMECR
jgi:Cof subfamily protein (haloacid dehalogenase superfamily)